MKFGLENVTELLSKPLFYSITEQMEQAIMKLVVIEDSDRVLGAYMVGGHPAEIIESLAVAKRIGNNQIRT
ncbi:MAG: hypothetical protein KME05_16780 [Gloeocapsa sp. UFS-A4-WI-NPMV-4B04]|nr:hypothetical protein [Gloeocapsa sp. UFS-A4-WI-NPMV-4B04]